MSWHKELKEGVSTAQELSKFLPLTEAEIIRMDEIIEKYPMTITRYYLSLIDKTDPNDPIRKMCVPDIAEFAETDGVIDTSGEGDNTKVEGLQHKYTKTALMLSTNICAMYCRHCFRKRLVGISDEEINKREGYCIAYIKEHPELDNVLISGGDAFMNSNSVIKHYLEDLSNIDHIRAIRFGTRTPVVLPKRISDDPELLSILKDYGKKKRLYVITQFNHPRELTEEAKKAITLLMEQGVVVSNQTVLMRGINDSPDTLANLMTELVACGVQPYYVFQCRPVVGVHGHFQVPLEAGCEIVDKAKENLNGLAKRFRYAMSHVTGKIEILGKLSNGHMLFKYHQAKDKENSGRIITVKLREGQCWLEEEVL